MNVKHGLRNIMRVFKQSDSLRTVYPPDFDSTIIKIIERVKPFTQTSPERINALCEATKYIVDAKIPGEIVECGVWKGGSMMATALTLNHLHCSDRNLYLFDTYEGLPAPSDQDVDLHGQFAATMLADSNKNESPVTWCYSSLEEVKRAMYSTGYPIEKIHFIKGLVEETIPEQAPDTIAILRLDTDWYSSTYHELVHLFPRLAPGGVIIIDDYGHWQGARKAVDKYILEYNVRILLNRIDYTGRIGIKSPAT